MICLGLNHFAFSAMDFAFLRFDPFGAIGDIGALRSAIQLEGCDPDYINSWILFGLMIFMVDIGLV
jgi:hypothetical protein